MARESAKANSLAASRNGASAAAVRADNVLPADLSLDGAFQAGWVAWDERALRVLDDEGRVTLELPFSDVERFEVRGMVGCGFLEAKVGGQDRLVARFTVSHLPRYTALARYLNAQIAGQVRGPLELPEENVCPTCGRRLAEGTKVCPSCVNKFRVLVRLFRVAKPYTGMMLLGLVMLWALTGLRLLVPQINRMLIDNVLQPQVRSAALLLTFVGLLALSQVLIQLLSFARGVLMSNLSAALSKDLRAMVYNKIQFLSLSDISQRKTGDLMNRVTQDTMRIREFIQNHLFMALNEALIFIGIAVLLFSYSWRLALLVLVPAPIVVFIVRRIWRRIRRMYRAQWRKQDRVYSLLQDVLSGIRVVKAFGQEKREAERFVESTREFAEISTRNERTFNTVFPLIGYILGIGNFLVLYYGGNLVLDGRMGFGELLQFSQYAGMLYGPLRFISFFPRWFTEAMTATERIFEVIDVEPKVSDRPGAVHHKIVGEVVLKDVTFGYKSYEPVLEGINLHVKPGEMIGLVGHSGAGKSTLINLIARFYDVDEGQILIDGIDIRDIAQQTLRSQIGVVLQETFLFSGTIAANISYAKPDASPEEIIRAAKIANAHDFIVRFNDGYETLVGERGQRLSGGERQRIAIARAILHNPKILILDEATASMDTETEYQIQEALARLVKNRTTFAIAHRLSTLRNATRLVVLDKGKVAEVGTHDELMERRGIYYGLVMAQRQMSQIRPASDGALSQVAQNGKASAQ